MLDQIKIASPCSADWDRMEGTDRVRFCGECKKNVFNLSAMTRRDAEACYGRRMAICVPNFIVGQMGRCLRLTARLECD
jgi:hypothetical protein